jgi:predicted nucleic acid-binding protein
VTSAGVARAEILVLDAMELIHFARAERLDVFRDLLVDADCWTTRVVLEEVRRGPREGSATVRVDDIDWLTIAELDTLAEISCFVAWAQRVGAGDRDLGEASVLAAAELRGGIAITDDREAVKVGRAHGLDVHGTIWLLARFCRDGKLAAGAAGNLIDALRETGLRLPCTGAEFPQYARRYGLL